MSFFRTHPLGSQATAVILIAIPFAAANAADAPSIEDRFRFQETIEGVNRAHRAASVAEPRAGSFEQAPTREELRTKVVKHLKMADALYHVWGRRITGVDLQAEYDRIVEHSNDRELLGRLLDALDHDPVAVAAGLVEPISVRRAIHEAYWWDEEMHGELRRRANEELLTDDGAGGLDWFTGVRTETEWRLAGESEPPGVEFEGGVQIRKLNREQWSDLDDDLGHQWVTAAEPESSLTRFRFSPLEEAREWFSASVILEKSDTRLRLATHTWWKRTFSDWWEEHAQSFRSESPETDYAITLSLNLPVARPESETKEHIAAGDAWFPMNTSDPDTPSARDRHTVVWTGTHMIVWGGTNGAQVFSSGGIYDPATDSWSATSQGSGCPSARIDHTMTWTRGRVFIWGGWDGSTNTNTGSKYNPSTNTWTALAVDANTPTPRHDHAAIDNGWLYIWGGRTGSSLTSTAAYYDYNLDSWMTDSPTPDTPTAREMFLSVEDPDDSSHFIWGGSEGTGYPSTGGRHDLGGAGWLPWNTSGAPSGRFGHSGVVTRSWPCGGPNPFTELIIWGGFAPSEPSPFYTNTGAINGISWVATPTGTGVPSGRIHHTAVMAADTDVMIVWGGTTSTGVTSSGGLMDYCDSSWSPTGVADPDLPSPRSDHTAVWTGKTMLVWGGSTGSAALGDGGAYTFCWDPPTAAATPTVADEDPCDDSGVRISWSSTPTWNDYDVQRTVAILRDGAVIASDLPPSAGSYLDTTAVADQSYDYRVRFVNSCGLHSTSDAVSGVDESTTAPTVTSAPIAVDADGCNASSGIDVTWPVDPDDWGDDGIGDRRYRVWRWRNSVEGWVAMGGQLDYGTTSYHDPNPGQAKYRVKYINGCDRTADSPETPTITDQAGTLPSVSQTVTTADADACIHSGNSITWPADPDHWGDGGTGDRYYRVRRSTDGVTFDPIGSNITYGTTSFVDATANPDQQYHYQVRYKNGCDLSSDSATDTATDVDGDAPVTNFNSSAVDTDSCIDGGVTVSWPAEADDWGDNGSGSRTYGILRDGSAIQSGIAHGSTSFVDTTGVNGTAYLYQVRYTNGCGLDAATAGDNGNDLPTAPSAPFNNTASDIDACAATGVLVSWNADPDGPWGDGGGAHTYDVLRDGVVLQSGIAYGVTDFTDTTGTPGTPYVYTVRYVNCGALHSETTGVTATDINGTPATPGAPVVTDASACAQDGVWVNWTPSAGAATYDLRVDGSTTLNGVTDPTLFDPGNSSLHTFEVRANGASCPAAGWSQATVVADLIDPDAEFCDGFRTGDTSGWTGTAP